jgi:hypothetical protein
MDQFENSQDFDDGNRTTILFLGLFLLILAFFILLVSISTIEDVKSKEVMESLTSTFADVAKPVTDPVDFLSKSGETLGPEAFLSVVEGVFTTAVKIDKVQMVQPGRLMVIRLHARELFADDKIDVRPTRYDLIDRIVSSLAAKPEGIKFEMVFLMGSSFLEDSDMPVDESIEMERVGSFLRLSIERDADPATLSGGIMPGDPSDITIKFYVHGELEDDDVEEELISDDNQEVIGELGDQGVQNDQGPLQ